MNNAGVKILITSQSTHNSYLSRQGAGNAVAYGLSEEDALKALTINVASVFGLDERIGTLEVGKDADLLIWDGHPLEVSSFTMSAFEQAYANYLAGWSASITVLIPNHMTIC